MYKIYKFAAKKSKLKKKIHLQPKVRVKSPKASVQSSHFKSFPLNGPKCT